MEAGAPTIIPNAEGARTTPSVVAYSKSGELLVGQIAKRQAVVNPENTFYSVKRFVGRQPNEVGEELKEVSYKVDFEGQKVKIDCPVLSKKFAPEEVSAQVLRKLSGDAGTYLSATVQKATKDAGKIAGLDVLRIVNVIVDWLAEDFQKTEGIDLLKDRQALQRLTEAAEKAKIELSGVQEAKISLPFITADATGPKHIEQSLSRAKFETPVENALKDSKISASEINEIVLVGGSTRIPSIQSLASELVGGKKPNQSVFSTATDSQPSVEIVVLQGERQFAKDNKILGTFRLDGVPPAPRGVPQIEVTFDIDANGILNVGAKDRGTGKEQTITIAGSSTLDKTDVDKMVQDAEANAAEDSKRKDAVETKNNAESLVYQTEKQLSDLGDKVPADLKASIDPKLQALKDKVAEAEPDTELLKTMTKDLQEELMKVGQAAYANTGGAAPEGAPEGAAGEAGAPPPGDAKGKDDVIDVDGQ
ncbi:dnaK2 [Symbiodinium sp. KB8]|nr:dnaK2 [Symbiodinium sp. KB8]